MRVAAVIPTKNRPADLVEAVRSILNQVVPPNELVVVDQSESEDGQQRVIDLFNTMKTDVRLNYILDASIKGLVAARAAAVEVAQGDVVMFFEDDVLLEPDFIGTMMNAFATEPQMMGGTGIISNYAPSRLYRFFHRLFHCGIFHDPRLDWHGRSRTGSDSGSIRSEPLVQSSFLNGGLSAYKREVFDRVKFDCVNGFHMVEDIEFSVRAAEEFGANRFFIVPGARLLHNSAPAGRDGLKAKYLRKTREYIIFFKKRRRSPAAIANITWLLFGMALESSIGVFRYKSFEPLSGMIRGIFFGLQQKVSPWD